MTSRREFEAAAEQRPDIAKELFPDGWTLNPEREDYEAAVVDRALSRVQAAWLEDDHESADPAGLNESGNESTSSEKSEVESVHCDEDSAQLDSDVQPGVEAAPDSSAASDAITADVGDFDFVFEFSRVEDFDLDLDEEDAFAQQAQPPEPFAL